MFNIRSILLILGVALLLVFPLALNDAGFYGLTLFVFIPVGLGALASWLGKPATKWRAAAWGGGANAAACLFLLALGREGMICILIALPLTIPLGIVGALIMRAGVRLNKLDRSAAVLLFLPFGAGTMGWDTLAKPPVFAVQSEIEIAATPEQVWPHVIAFPDLAAPGEWYFQTGLAYPVRTRIEGEGAGAARQCDLSTGTVEEVVEVWDAPRELTFRVTETPAPMVEWNPWMKVEPKHLHGYFNSHRGQFRLIALPNGHTRVIGTSWYSHGMWPAAYWKLWCDAIAHRIHWRVFAHIKELSEQ